MREHKVGSGRQKACGPLSREFVQGHGGRKYRALEPPTPTADSGRSSAVRATPRREISGLHWVAVVGKQLSKTGFQTENSVVAYCGSGGCSYRKERPRREQAAESHRGGEGRGVRPGWRIVELFPNRVTERELQRRHPAPVQEGACLRVPSEGGRAAQIRVDRIPRPPVSHHPIPVAQFRWRVSTDRVCHVGFGPGKPRGVVHRTRSASLPGRKIKKHQERRPGWVFDGSGGPLVRCC